MKKIETGMSDNPKRLKQTHVFDAPPPAHIAGVVARGDGEEEQSVSPSRRHRQKITRTVEREYAVSQEHIDVPSRIAIEMRPISLSGKTNFFLGGRALGHQGR